MKLARGGGEAVTDELPVRRDPTAEELARADADLRAAMGRYAVDPGLLGRQLAEAQKEAPRSPYAGLDRLLWPVDANRYALVPVPIVAGVDRAAGDDETVVAVMRGPSMVIIDEIHHWPRRRASKGWRRHIRRQKAAGQRVSARPPRWPNARATIRAWRHRLRQRTDSAFTRVQQEPSR
jgi:hypothetical protein